jgi:hypothetical protein
MNPDSAGTRFPHLDLGDLIAGASGQAVDNPIRDHLDGCASCQLELSRWTVIANGVRGLAGDVAEAAPQAAPPGRPRRTRRPALARPVRRAMQLAGGVAAALILLFGAGIVAGVVHVHLSGAGAGTAVTSVSGCSRLRQAAGTVERAGGRSVVIRTASGRLVTVTTTKSTRLTASGALLGDITDGAAVVAAGTGSGGTIAADYVVVGSRPSLTVPGIVTVTGTVSDAGAEGFTVVTSAGTPVRVTTSGATAVTVFRARPGQLQNGARTIALGYARPDGTMSGIAVLQPPGWPAGAHASITVHGCSRGAISHAIMALASGG